MVVAPLRAVVAATRMAAAAGVVVAGVGRSLAGVAPKLTALTQAVAGVAIEAAGGPSQRRSSTNGRRHWIEVRGLHGADAGAIATDVLAAVRATPGVQQAFLNRVLARLVVTVDADGPAAARLCRIVADAERRDRMPAPAARPASLPGDDAVVLGPMVAAAAASAGLGLSLTGSLLRLPRLPDLVAVAPTLADHLPRLRRELELRVGPEGTDVLFGCVNAATAALTLSPTAAAAETINRGMLAAEAIAGRLSWRRHEPALSSQPIADDSALRPRDTQRPADGPAERYANRIGVAGIGAAAVVGLLSRNPDTAGAAALAAVPKPLRTVREAFGCAMSRGLTAQHDALVLQPRALRSLDRVDTIMIDPRALYTDDLTVSRVVGVDDSERTRAWEAVRAALDDAGLAPGWHALADIPGAGCCGETLISPVRDPHAAAVVTEARRARPRVFSVQDDGLRSLAQGFDALYPSGESIDDAIASAVAELKAGGATVALLTTSQLRAAHRADVTIGVARQPHPPPWGADVFVSDLGGAWRVLHALPAARAATDSAIRLSASASAIGGLMLIPGVPGRGSASVNVGMAASLYLGFRAGTKVFRDPVPEPETGHEWHSLPVTEVRRLLPRPPDEHPGQGSTWRRQLAPIRLLHGATVVSWQLVRDFADEMRDDLSDPITPLLATGAAASALLGSPLDALLVGNVVLLNAALSAEQQLHAERVLNRLLAVQDPAARRRLGPLDERRREKVPAAQLRPGDIIEVHADEVVPADARLLDASNVEVDESTLTGESLPVSKQTEPTPGAPLADRDCMLYAGTTMIAGTAVAVVTAVGSRSEMRRALAMAPRKSREIGLQRQLSRITRRLFPFSVASVGLVGLLSVARGTRLREAVASAVTLLVAAIPEGLTLVVTLAQLAAARRLTGESVLIRNARSIEALARLNVVCFDKTGTLSENRLKVKAVHPTPGFTTGQVLDAALSTTYSRHSHRVEHATDDAIVRAAGDPSVRGESSAPPRRSKRAAFLPFQSGRPFAAALVGTRLTIKGSPEVLLAALRHDDPSLTQQIESMAAGGLRVLAVAERHLSSAEAACAATDPDVLPDLCTAELTPIGLLGLADTPRPMAQSVLAGLAEREIEVRLITGDHPATASVIARELGIEVTDEEVITGSQWEALSADQRAAAVASRLVFARMSPEHKVEVVQALERSGLVTAMVGDGVNDAAAIRAASVGIGMAARGSDAARTAADVVLLDGRIDALLEALDEGQQLWRRVHSAVSVLLGGNVGEVCFALITALLTGRSVFNARQMLLVNMLTDALPAAALAVSPQTSTAEVERDEAAMWRAIGIRGASTTVGAMLAWLMASVTGTPRRAATVALIGLVGTQLAQTLADSHARVVVLTTVGSFAALGVVVSTPGLSQLFGCTPVGPVGWGQALLAAAVATLVSVLAPELLVRASATARRIVGVTADD
ncbi:cation-translocating P-type ATPase [Mycobacterium simiae]|uniref:Cation-translocating P-type ATPase n=1 Tax=Mycobacterium simiae TaxID=1784 RepID=A0A5B1BLT3_MYCSI|nr:cation-translocating P-type ATPase [Mycobacterium simiae]KAA1248430.1 cation-translocating P-type ATPase [Mycobacterium simiae]